MPPAILPFYRTLEPEVLEEIMKHLNFFKSALLTLLILCSNFIWAHDFEVDGIYYNILSETDKTVEVTYKGDYPESFNEYIGVVTIPSTIILDGTTYSVVIIGEYAFKGCNELTSISIPKGIAEIYNSAFCFCI